MHRTDWADVEPDLDDLERLALAARRDPERWGAVYAREHARDMRERGLIQ